MLQRYTFSITVQKNALSLSQLSHWVKKVVEYDPMNQQGNQYFLFIGSE
jgi:hypothetical protein